jgi:methyl-accepting chemotaxis protein
MSLRTKLIAPVLALLGLLALIFCAFLSYQDYTAGRESMEKAASVVARLQASAVAQGLWDMDNRQVQDVLTGLSAYPGFVSGEVVDTAGKSIARIGSADQGSRLLDVSAEIARKDAGKMQTIGRLVMRVSTVDLDRMIWRQIWLGASAFLLLMMLSGAGMWAAVRRVTDPLLRLASAMRALAGGDRSVEIGVTDRGDEIGVMVQAVEVFRQNAGERERLEVESRHAAAAQVARDRALAERFEASVKGVVEAVSAASVSLHSTVNGMVAAADETSRETSAVATASEQAASNVEMVTAAIEELSAAGAEIGRRVTDSTRIAERAVAEADRTSGTVKGLAEAAGKIGQVIDLINNIAGQTNLLALNATIEAARAGEAGKGFAIVASEVKNLASQTAKATEEIAAQIAGMQHATEEVTKAIAAISATVAEISEVAAAMAGAIQEQDATTQGIAANAQRTSTGTNEVLTTIGSVAKAVAETGRTAKSVLGYSGDLNDQAAILQNEVEAFLGAIKQNAA